MLATITVVLKLIIESKKNKVTLFNAFVSWIFALGISYVFYPIILENINKSWQGISIGLVVLTGEKIVTFVLYKVRVEEGLAWVFDMLFQKLKSLFK